MVCNSRPCAVCGETVDIESNPIVMEYHGMDYYCCDEACKEEFDSNPQLYANRQLVLIA